jgi:hypothetical protein
VLGWLRFAEEYPVGWWIVAKRRGVVLVSLPDGTIRKNGAGLVKTPLYTTAFSLHRAAKRNNCSSFISHARLPSPQKGLTTLSSFRAIPG